MMESSFPLNSPSFCRHGEPGQSWDSVESGGPLDRTVEFEVPIFGESTQHASICGSSDAARSYDDRNTAVSHAIAKRCTRLASTRHPRSPRVVQWRSAGGQATSTCGSSWPSPTSRPSTKIGVKKIITQCALLQPLSNESPQLGGNYESFNTPAVGRAVAEGIGRNTRWRDTTQSHLSRPLLSRPSQRHLPGAAGGGFRCWQRRDDRDATAWNPRPLLRSRRCTILDGRAHRQEDQHRTSRRSAREGASEIAGLCPYAM